MLDWQVGRGRDARSPAPMGWAENVVSPQSPVHRKRQKPRIKMRKAEAMLVQVQGEGLESECR